MNQRNVIITGAPGLLASHLIAHRVFHSEGVFFCVMPLLAFEGLLSQTRAVALLNDLGAGNESLEAHLSAHVRRTALTEVPPCAEAWHFARALSEASDEFEWQRLAPVLRKAGVEELNYITTPYSGGSDWLWITEPQTESHLPFEPNLLEFPVSRVFTTSLTISPEVPVAATREGFLYFLGTLFDLKTEIEERLPDYFEYHALRCYAPANAMVNLIQVEQAAELILALATQGHGGRYVIASQESARFDDVLERVGASYGVSLLATEERAALNAIDALFDLRLMGFARHLFAPERERVEERYRIAGLEVQRLIVTEAEQDEMFDAIRLSQQSEQQDFHERANNILTTLTRKDVTRNGHMMTYYSSGPAEKTVVLVNALGQDAQYWFRLIDFLRHRFQVLIWIPRGIDSPPQPFRISDHADDLEFILQHEGAPECHLVSWCTGAKVAVEYYLRHPETVRSMVFLNTTLKCTDSPAELDTQYERDFAPLCRVLDQRPAMAKAMMNALASSVGGSDVDLHAATEEDVSGSVLAMMNAELKSHVVRPFSDPDFLINYARQVIDFWNYDLRQKAVDVQVPVLLLCSEHDRIASTQASEIIASLLPDGRVRQVPGATHYFLYDRSEVTAHLIENFFENPDTIKKAQDNPAFAPPAQAHPEDIKALTDNLSAGFNSGAIKTAHADKSS